MHNSDIAVLAGAQKIIMPIFYSAVIITARPLLEFTWFIR